MKKNKETAITISQDNLITGARYSYSVVEKRILYCIIAEVKRQYIDGAEVRTLFDDMVIHLDTSIIRKTDTDLRSVYKSLVSLRQKSIWIEEKNTDDWLELGWINYSYHKKNQSYIEVEVSKKLIPYLVRLAETYTTYSLTVAMSLQTKYSQRFYEFCSQFKNTGLFVINVNDLRKKLMLEQSYPRYALLKKYVIEPAGKELKKLFDDGQADIYFTYDEVTKGRTVYQLKFYIHDITKRVDEIRIDDKMYFIKQNLNSWFVPTRKPKNKEWIAAVINHLMLNTDKADMLYKRFQSLIKKEPTKNHAALARYIIEEDIL